MVEKELNSVSKEYQEKLKRLQNENIKLQQKIMTEDGIILSLIHDIIIKVETITNLKRRNNQCLINEENEEQTYITEMVESYFLYKFIFFLYKIFSYIIILFLLKTSCP